MAKRMTFEEKKRAVAIDEYIMGLAMNVDAFTRSNVFGWADVSMLGVTTTEARASMIRLSKSGRIVRVADRQRNKWQVNPLLGKGGDYV